MGAAERGLGDAPFGLVGRRLGHSWSPHIHERLGSAPYRLVELEPDEGEVLLGGAPFTGRTRLAPGTLAFVPDVPSFYDDLTAMEHVEFVLAANRADSARPRAQRLLERFGLVGHERLLPSAYSRGMREKLALVLALALRPRVLLLDEPHGPLDREASLALSDELAAAAREGTAVLLSCHHDVPGLAPDLSLELAGGALRATEA